MITERARTYGSAAEMLNQLFADNLHALRRARRMSRRELADLSGIPFHSIEKIEVGCSRPGKPRRRVSIGEAVVLAKALDVQPAELLRPRGPVPVVLRGSS